MNKCKNFKVYDTTEQLVVDSMGGENNSSFEVKYNIPGKGDYTEAIIHKVTNGISVNYPEFYMRRRDPDAMSVADDFPRDKEKFCDKYGYVFLLLKSETLDWLMQQELAVLFYFAGRYVIGLG